MKTVAGIANLLLSLQPKSVRLALLLLEQQPVYGSVQNELLFVYLMIDDKPLKEWAYHCLIQHSQPQLAQALQTGRFQLITRGLEHHMRSARVLLYEYLRDDGGLETVPQLATWIYQATNKELVYLLETLEVDAIKELLTPRWTDHSRHLDLSGQDLGVFPKKALEVFHPVYSLDLRHNPWLYPIGINTLLHFPTLKTLYLEPSKQKEEAAILRQALPNLTLLA